MFCEVNTTLHNCFCSIYKGSSKQIQEEEEVNKGGGEKRKKGRDATKGIPSMLMQNKLLIVFLSPEIP